MKKIFISLLIVFSVFLLVIVNNTQAADTTDETIKGAQNFIKEGEKNKVRIRNAETGQMEYVDYGTVDDDKVHNVSNFLYNLFLGVGIIAAVVVGSIIGIKLMLGGIEEKAQYKELLWPYLISCAVVFGAFGIWKLVVDVLVKI